ncbi:hypothetical protein A2U01_0028771, partial [Trifolium medium]|nr:hypothetical protein [Trifolium medium]
SCSDDALLHKQSITSIVLPLLASSMVLVYFNALTYTHEILMPYMHKVHDLHIDGKPVYSADEVSKARDTDGVVGPLRRSSRLSVFIATILTKVVALSDVFKKDPKS